MGPQGRKDKVFVMLEIKFSIICAIDKDLANPSFLGHFRITLIHEYRYALDDF